MTSVIVESPAVHDSATILAHLPPQLDDLLLVYRNLDELVIAGGLNRVLATAALEGRVVLVFVQSVDDAIDLNNQPHDLLLVKYVEPSSAPGRVDWLIDAELQIMRNRYADPEAWVWPVEEEWYA